MKDGVLLINKPTDFTSFDVVAKLRGILKERHLGHGGTLDPNVTGVLPIFVGKATKAIDLVSRQEKKYTATFVLGKKTDTQDIWGDILEEKEPETDLEKIKEAVLSFKGESQQLPPMYSAVKVNGVRLYALAREGREIEREKRNITVYDIDFEGKTQNENEYKFSIFCSKGTYVRTICADIGDKLDCGGTMTSLVRTQSMGFDLCNCYTLSEVEQAMLQNRAEELILPIDELFTDLAPIYLDEKNTHLYKNGVGLNPKRVSGVIYDPLLEIAPYQRYRVYGCDRSFIGIGHIDYTKREFKSVKMFICNEEKG